MPTISTIINDEEKLIQAGWMIAKFDTIEQTIKIPAHEYEAIIGPLINEGDKCWVWTPERDTQLHCLCKPHDL